MRKPRYRWIVENYVWKLCDDYSPAIHAVFLYPPRAAVNGEGEHDN